jgi:hypothetical protein
MVARGLGRVYASTATPQARTRWDLDVAGAGPDGFVRRRRGFLELGCGFTRTLSTAFEAFYTYDDGFHPWRPIAGHSAF